MSVKVAVRVRPYNARENDMGAELCIKMVDKTTTIFDTKSGATRDFTFDYSFWSHDGFEEIDGYFTPIDDKYADQRKVYMALGEEVLNNAWEGYNCCLFAYGQTGSGKSYSMVGYGNNKGIIPISFKEIFQRTDSRQSETLSFEVLVSMLEIYNEKTQDLLVPVNQRVSGGLKIRESKEHGVFVEDLSKVQASSYEEIERLMELGNTHRSIGATNMNATSSRAHTIFTIEFKQITKEGNKKMEKVSVINLVDLAGSEKAGQTGATGDRLKEGCAINKSLVVLGSVIEALADKSMGKKGNIVVPYRDSALTRILSSALGGNSKTIMICALSPATVNYEETLSTLRYADRAKKIKNHAVVNETVEAKLTRENTELKNLLEELGGKDKIMELTEQVRELGGTEKLKELKEQILALEKLKQEGIDFNTYQKRQVAVENELMVDISGPHLKNITEDQQLTGKVCYNFDKVPLVAGRKNANPPCNLIFASSSVSTRHCIFDKNEDGKITLTACDEKSSLNLFVNGKRFEGPVILNHMDRILIGTSTMFLFKIPGEFSELKENEIDYEFVQDEKQKYDEEEFEKAMPKPLTRGSRSLSQVEPPLPHHHHHTGDTTAVPQPIETLVSPPPAQPESFLAPPTQEPIPPPVEQHYEEPLSKKKILHNKLAKLFPLINEANMLATDLSRNAKFSAKIINILPDDVKEEEDLEPERWEKELKVEVVSQDYGLIWYWDSDKFEDRLCMLRELIDEKNVPSPDEDPLWDPPEENLIGKGYYSLKPLGLLFDNPFDILIISAWGGDAGYLRMNIVPIDEDGQLLDEGPDTPDELINQLINFQVEINEARNLPQTHSNNVYCEFHFPGLGIRRTSIVPGYSEQPIFNWKEQFTNVLVDEALAKYMQTNKLAVCLYGTGMAMKVETPRRTLTRPKNETTEAKAPCAETKMEENAKKYKAENEMEIRDKKKNDPRGDTDKNRSANSAQGKRKDGGDSDKTAIIKKSPSDTSKFDTNKGEKKKDCIVF
ncbi:hypothetical protein SteCoe_26390 [Stentor coeruleus]|uniref:Kinesin motor domain-containing protein n=1 Tax=Stentor coeruleus TaxID=5963 RepID=A0A1R2BD09_9CILI|nr:hypothetical protein SteCoe_26390 [Stentor coeruleus]